MNKFIVFLSFLLFLPLTPAKAGYLDTVRERGYLICGVTERLKGLSYVDENGDYSGFYPELCRFVAAATLGSKDLVEFVTITERERAIEALKQREIDIIASPIAATVIQSLKHRIINTTPIYYDTKRIMVHSENRKKTVKDMADAGVTFCYTRGVPASYEIAKYVKTKVSLLKIEEYNTYSQIISAFTKKNCDAIYEEYSVLNAISKYASVNDYYIIPEILSYSVVPPLIIASDKIWSNITMWSINLLIAAEDSGVNKEYALSKGKDAVNRLLKLDKASVEATGFSMDFAYNAISQVGNYEDIYNRTILKELGLERGMNAIGREGGSLYSPSF